MRLGFQLLAFRPNTEILATISLLSSQYDLNRDLEVYGYW